MVAAVRQSAIAHASGTAVTATFPFATLAGSVLVAFLFDGGLFTLTVTDNKSGGSSTYTPVAGVNPFAYTTGSNSNTATYCHYVENCASGITQITGTLASAGVPVLIILELTGCLTSGSLGDVTKTNPTGSASPTSNSITSGTYSQAANIVLSSSGSGSNASTVSWGVSSGWTLLQSETDQFNYWPGAVASQHSASTTGLTATWTLTGGGGLQNLNLVQIAFKEATGSLTLTPVSSTASLGSTSLGAGIAKGVTATSSTTAPGNVAGNVSLALSGVSATGTVGSVGTGPPVLQGATATGSAGTTKANAALALSGNASTASASNVGPGVSRAASAVSSTTSVSSAGPSAAAPLVGTVSIAAVGSLAPRSIAALAAVTSATSLGATGANISVALTGVSSTCTVGSVRPPGTALGPVSTTGAAGSVGLALTAAVSAVSSTLTPGTVRATPQRLISGVSGTGSAGTVVFGNVVVRLGGVAAFGSVGQIQGPRPPDTRNGELFFAQQMALPAFYTGKPPSPSQRGAIFYDSGTWTVPLGARNVYCSASAGGGTPLGLAGQQALKQWLSVNPGDVLTVTMLPNGDVTVYVGSVLLLRLYAGHAYGKITWQAAWGQQSGLPGGFGSGVDAGIPFPPILVFYWN